MTDRFDPDRERAFLRVVEKRLDEAQSLHLWSSVHLSPEIHDEVAPGLLTLIHTLQDLRHNCRGNLNRNSL